MKRNETFRHELEDSHGRGTNGHTKRCEHDRDTLRPSNTFPEVLSGLWGKRREAENSWKHYYLGGRTQVISDRIEHPAFDPGELSEPET